MKRSQTVSLVLLAGAGAAAYAIARHDPSQDEEEVRVYASPAECVAARLRTEAECGEAYETARALYPEAAPRYSSMGECQEHHGPDQCVPGASVAEAAIGQYLPVMVGYVIGASAAQGLSPQPIFRHAPWEAPAAGGSGGSGYCTGSGARIFTTGGGRSSVARVSSAALRGFPTGGFGSTGRSYASGARGFFGG